MKRSRTNTTLQALVLFNDKQFVEAARVLADSVLEEGVMSSIDDTARVQQAFR